MSTDSSIVFHKDTWIGAVELDEKHAHIIRAAFKCPICRSYTHTFIDCPTMKNWIFIKKDAKNKDNRATATSAVAGAVSSVATVTIVGQANSVRSVSSSIAILLVTNSNLFTPLAEEDSDSDTDHEGTVDFDIEGTA